MTSFYLLQKKHYTSNYHVRGPLLPKHMLGVLKDPNYKGIYGGYFARTKNNIE